MAHRRDNHLQRNSGLRVFRLASGTAAALLLMAQPSLAQTSGLRTAADNEEAPSGSALQALAAAPVYEPVSEGALPREPRASFDIISDSPSLFDPEQADPFSDRLPRPATPTNQRQRAAEAPTAADPAQPSGRRQLRAGGSVADARASSDDVTGTIDSLPAQAQARLDADALLEDTNQRTPAIEARRRTFEETPFAPVGLRAGKFLLFPTLEQGLVYTSNASSSADGKPALLSESTLRLSGTSDWSRHSAALSGYATYRKSLDGEETEDYYGGLDAALRLDLANDYALDLRGNYLITPESATSPVVIEGTLDEPIRQTMEASAGLSRSFGQLRLSGTGRVEREIYGDADLSTGGTLSQKDRNSTLAAFVLRTGWELSPVLIPFVEGEIGKRFYDNEADAAGYQRTSLRTGLRAGLEFDFTEKLQGEFAAGWLGEEFDDDRLQRLSGATFSADLTWSPLRGTTVAINADTTVEGSTTPGDSGSIFYSAGLTATRELRANLTGTASLGLGWRDYKNIDGRDLIWNGETTLTYWFNRYAGITARGRYEQVSSNLPFRDTDTASIYLGLKLQR
ncbi:outer membrane beta-barrel protein [Tianweitania sediminis]|uniref:Outer membrane beta-barrel protein n=1 Tax=Tianweitania sediminis TaxID=1502156 RepID=A0A8J7RNX9_9HYPH|nr:outer membrane beta-barrel protein [Tianweitania sediminis]MBP0439299.1 outer membrane beta-barrel protein [Tianweitania sediminis]